MSKKFEGAGHPEGERQLHSNGTTTTSHEKITPRRYKGTPPAPAKSCRNEDRRKAKAAMESSLSHGGTLRDAEPYTSGKKKPPGGCRNRPPEVWKKVHGLPGPIMGRKLSSD